MLIMCSLYPQLSTLLSLKQLFFPLKHWPVPIVTRCNSEGNKKRIQAGVNLHFPNQAFSTNAVTSHQTSMCPWWTVHLINTIRIFSRSLGGRSCTASKFHNCTRRRSAWRDRNVSRVLCSQAQSAFFWINVYVTSILICQHVQKPRLL